MKILILLLFLVPGLSRANEMWKENLHLLVGGGGNLSDYRRTGDVIGTGLHFKTDVAYAFRERWAVETGSFVRFNYLHDTFIWDTLLTVGVRRRLAEDHYVRLFAGKAPTVFFTKDTPEVYRRSDSTRILYTGPVVGASWGKFSTTKAGTDWFWEISSHYQSLESARGIKGGTVPEVVFVTGKEKIRIYSISVSFGILVF